MSKSTPPKRSSLKRKIPSEFTDDTVVMIERENEVPARKDVLDMLLGNEQPEYNFFADEPVHYEGQLAIDMIETKTDLIVVSTVAGADTKQLSIHVHGDVLTIRGKRENPVRAAGHEYLYKECFWGWFSRTIVLPVDVKTDETRAEFHNGVLTVTMPKEVKNREVPIHIIEE